MQRQLALDGARGFTVLFIPAIHTVMVYSEPYVYSTWLGYFLMFIAEGPGAQIFMTMMGIVFTFKARHDTSQIIKRAGLLLLAGYLLNAGKFIFPFVLGGLPIGVQQTLDLREGNELIDLLLMGDILHFAAIALIMIHVLYRLSNYWFWSAAIAITLIIITPLLFDSGDHYLGALFTGKPPQIFFPIISWIIYPLIGLTIGYGLKRNARETYYAISIAAAVFLVIGLMLLYFFPTLSPDGFYRPFAPETCIHISITLLALWTWNTITPFIIHSPFFKLISFCSENITAIYFSQWILICWLLPVVGYQTMNLTESIFTACWISVMIIGGTYLIKQYHKNEPR